MPNAMPGTGRYVETPMAVPTAGLREPPTWRGSSMEPAVVTKLLPGSSFDAKGSGAFSLITSDRFPRGPRLSGRQGTIDMLVRLGTQGLVAAIGTLTLTANVANGETVTIGVKTYTFQTTLTNVNGNVQIGSDAAESIFNLVAAINLGGGVGTRYATATTLHPTVSGAEGPGLTLIATAKTPGPGGNSIATTETSSTASWGGATLAGGSSTESTLCYLTDDASNPQEVIAIGVDSSNRPTFLIVTRPGAGTVTVAVGTLTLTGNMADVAATGTLTSTGQVSDGNTVVIGSKTYTFEATLTDVDGHVQIGGTQALSMENLRRAINLDGTAGVNYAASMTLHPTVSATDTATQVIVTAKTPGEEGNTIVTTENAVELSWGSGTLTGGLNDRVEIDGKVYKFQTVLTDYDGNVLIGATASDSIDNLIAAITLGAGSGTLYAASMTEHPTVTVTPGVGDTMDVAAKTPGADGNNITTSTTSANASWGGATLAGGSGGPLVIAEVTPSGAAYPDGSLLSIRATWDSQNPVGGTGRHATFSVNGVATPSGDWSTDPLSPWEHFQPLYLVLGQGYGGVSDFDGEVLTWQGSEAVTP